MTETSPVLELTKAHCILLDKKLEDLTADVLKSLFGHVYYYWRTVREEVGEELGVKLYGKIWEQLAQIGFAAAMEKFNLTEVKDLPTLGRIVQECFTGVPTLYIIKRNEPTEHVGHIQWCANPGYGPADNVYNRHDYYRKEVYLTYVYIWAMITEAQKHGLDQEITVDIPSGRCRDGACGACQMVLRTKDADPSRHLPEVENRYIEQEMDGVEPVKFILEKQKRTFEEQGPSSFSGFFAIDMIGWQQLFTNVPDKTDEIYCRVWGHYWNDWVNEAKLDLEIGKVTTARELADIITYCQKKRYIAYTSSVDDSRKISLKAIADPFIQVGDMFEAPDEYKQSLLTLDQHFLNSLLGILKLEGKAEAKVVSHIGSGDLKTEISVCF